MSLPVGTRLGPYVIEAPLGSGGMGEVYRARDSRLNREVALKVLPDAFSSDPDRRARFSREAQLLASLNHPNIGAIYGFEERLVTDVASGFSRTAPALVLELVEGRTLADQIAGGPIPLDESVVLARQIADALEAAHEHGVIHRDLKPANIKIRADGTVKVLDFGLAKAMQDGTDAGGQTGTAELSQSPTVTSPAVTRIGVIMGTASYMSPEQARGLAVDRRADIWAWACVVYEMLTGRRAFDGADTTEVIAAVVRGEPDWSHLPVNTSHEIRRLLHRCLEKDRKRRFADIRDVRFALDDAQTLPVHPPAPAVASNRRERLAWAGALLLCLVGTAAIFWRGAGESGTGVPARQTRAEITTPPTTDPASLALSPNGEHLAFVAFHEGRPKLWVRSLMTGDAQPLTGTDGASFPFWSPDSRSIGFFANEQLYRIDVDGGALRALARAAVGAGGTWNRDGTVVFTIVPDAPISRVSAMGGEVQALPTSQQGPGGNRFPQFLPDGRHFLYFMAEMAVRGVYVGTLDGPERMHLFDADAAAVFVPPEQIVFLRAGTLFIQRFDPGRLALEGTAVPLAKGIAVDNTGMPAVSASSIGSLVYRIGSGNRQRQLAWVDRSGAQIGEAFAPDQNNPSNPSLSPDGRQLAMSRVVAGNADVWVLDLDRRGAFRRISNAPTPDIAPVWSPDGKRIAYAGRGRDNFALVERPTATVGDESLLVDTAGQEIPVDWSDDGRFILYRQQVALLGQLDLWALPMEGDRTPIPVATGSGDERHGQFSPDGKWVAYESNESGRVEVYVQPFPGPAASTVVSTEGGRQARWSRDGRELFYLAPDARLMAVAMRIQKDGRTIDPATPVPLFQTRLSATVTGGSVVEYDVTKAGTFLMNTLVVEESAPITFILNLRSRQE
jgi:Tol biopolymer transport system component